MSFGFVLFLCLSCDRIWVALLDWFAGPNASCRNPCLSYNFLLESTSKRLDDCTCIFDLLSLGWRICHPSANLYSSLKFHAVSRTLRCLSCVFLMLMVSVTESLLSLVYAISMLVWKMIFHQFALYFWLDFCSSICLFLRIWHFLVRSVNRMNDLV